MINNHQVFVDYANWLNQLLTSRGMSTQHIIHNFKQIQKAIENKLESQLEEFYQQSLSLAITSLLNVFNLPK